MIDMTIETRDTAVVTPYPAKSLMICVRFSEELGVGIERCMALDGYTNRSVWVRALVADRIGRGS